MTAQLSKNRMMNEKPSSTFAEKAQFSLHDPLPVGSKQKTELKESFSPRTRLGGFERVKQRKIARPFNENAPLHLVLRSGKAKREWSMLHRKHKNRIISMVFVYAERFKVRVYHTANTGSQLHLLVKAKERKHLADFLRVLAGRVAVTVTGARKRVKKIGKFWDYLTWSRLVNWGHDFFNVRKYIQADDREEFFNEPLTRTFDELAIDGWNPSQARGS